MLFSFLKTKAEAKRINSGVSSDNLAGIKNTLQFLDEEKLYPDFHTITGYVNEPEVEISGKKYLMFCSNNYLGITQNQEVKDAAKDAIDRYGVGPGGSRVISGNVDIVETLEKEIASLTDSEDCMIFPTGYMANISVFQALMDPLFFNLPYKSSDSVIFSDEKNHGSIVDGIRLSKATRVIFKHNDIADLRRKITEYDLPNKLIVTEGVFSLEGEIIDLPAYVSLARETGSKLMIDDAHGIGVLGSRGGGTPEHLGCAGEIDILMGSFDKAFGCMGGYLCGKATLIKYLRIACRSSILSSSFPTPLAGALIRAVRVIKQGTDKRERIV
ncbi:MAG: aminotransferase class I/II-fold pyridoxal phosphate-dependent enzyme, partial [Candidatus Binatia bacterium]